ncbi:hypothetical protein Ancab_035667 [Ancistrocladus abbreviatus]
MFGSIRASPFECLELERPLSKIVKHDSLSIYEATLMKLKQGSKCSLSSPNEALDIGGDCTSKGMPGSSLHNLSLASQDAIITEKDHLNGSVLEGSLNFTCLQGEEEMLPDSDCSSASVSSSSSSKQQKSKNLSIQYLFSKYNSTRQTQGFSHQEPMIIEQSSSKTISSSSSDVESTNESN